MAQALPILVPAPGGGFRLMKDNLHSILHNDKVRDRPAVLISIAGAFRKGKSFLLDMMLRYLSAADKDTWLDTKSRRARGFPWQSGYKRHTTGILMWSEGIPVTLPSGEKAVILLMDTQGTFDKNTTVHESSMVFALSTLLSSLQIYNLQNNVQSDDLGHLQLFTEYGRLALEDNSSTPFQKLLFLVRDWQFGDDLQFGSAGGQQLIDEWLQCTGGGKELDRVRQHIRNCFTEIRGFLLPHPGARVATSRQFDGSAADMAPEFVTGLKKLMPTLLAPESLTVKTIAGNPLRCRDLVDFMETYVALFKSDKLPQPKSILAATAEANNMSAMHDARSLYITQMEKVISKGEPSLSSKDLECLHNKTARKAQQAFQDCKKMGGRALSETYLGQLQMEMEAWFKVVQRNNNIKREKEHLKAMEYNGMLASESYKYYLHEMSDVADGGVDFVPVNVLHQVHETARKAAVKMFVGECHDVDGVAGKLRSELMDTIDQSFGRMVYDNEAKKQMHESQMAAANMKAVSEAKYVYKSTMDGFLEQHVWSAEELEQVHERAKQLAGKHFDSLKAGDGVVSDGYLKALLDDLDGELSGYVRENQHTLKMKQMQEELDGLRVEADGHSAGIGDIAAWPAQHIFYTQPNIFTGEPMRAYTKQRLFCAQQ